MVRLNIKFHESTNLSPLFYHTEIAPEAKVYSLRKMIQNVYPACEISRQLLQYNGNYLEDDCTIGSYGFQDNGVVHLNLIPVGVRHQSEVFRARILGMNTFVLDLKGTMTVSHVKSLIAAKWGISSAGMKLIHMNDRRNIRRDMDDGCILHQYKLDGDSVILVDGQYKRW